MNHLSLITTGKRRLLIFEDENSMQTILSEAFMPDKFDLEFVSKQTIGVDEFSRPELILLDYNSAPMPSGENLCKKIKTIFPRVPLVVISAYPLNNLGAYNTYMDIFIAKPFDLDYFLNCVESCLLLG